jgi:hypothetical protein
VATRQVDRERRRRDVPWLIPSWTDPVVTVATRAVGGPLGRYAVVGARGPAGVAAVLVALGAVMLALGVVQKGHCLVRSWTAPDQFWRACYSDLPVVHVSSPLAHRALPWAGESPSTQPPLSGAVMWLIAQVSPQTGPGAAAQQWVFVLWALLATVTLVLAVLAAVALQPRRPWQAAHLAVSPVLVTLALVSTDLLGVALMLLGLWAWSRDRPWLAGVLLGPALLVRPFPALVLVAVVLLALRQRQWLPAARTVVGATLGALAVLVPLLLAEPQALTGAQRWWGQPAGYGAVQMVPQLLGLSVPAPVTSAVAVTGWVAALGWGWWRSRRPGPAPGLVPLSAVMLAVVVLTAASLSVQSGLWLLPLLALSTRPWWEHLLWAAAETLHFVTTWLHIAYAEDPGRGLPPDAYAGVVLLRAAAWVWLTWRLAQPPSPAPRSRSAPIRVGRTAVPTSGTTVASTSAVSDRT